MSRVADAVYAIAAAVSAPWWLRKQRSGWRERFGHTGALPAPGPRARLLIHAVSVGEVNLVRALVDRLAGDVEIVLATTTDTGRARARELYEGKAHLVRYPLDASWSVRRFLDAVRPDAVALVELELWPNFARECARREAPVCIVNGRLSDRSARRYRLARPLLGRWFHSLDFVGVQDEVYAARFVEAGADAARVKVLGSMKWDSAQATDTIDGAEELGEALGVDRSRPLIVAGSTAPEEHALLHEAAPPGVQLLCAPRRPEWFDGAAEALPGCVRRSRPGSGSPGAGRFLLDTIGELRKAYALADVVVIGRSFGSLYGSDPMEAAALGKAVLIGPSVADFRTAVETLEHAGAIVRSTRDRLAADLRRLFDHPEERAALAANARRCVKENQGATERHAALVLDMIRRRAPRVRHTLSRHVEAAL